VFYFTGIEETDHPRTVGLFFHPNSLAQIPLKLISFLPNTSWPIAAASSFMFYGKALRLNFYRRRAQLDASKKIIHTRNDD
jgi:hypothetical protein